MQLLTYAFIAAGCLVLSVMAPRSWQQAHTVGTDTSGHDVQACRPPSRQVALNSQKNTVVAAQKTNLGMVLIRGGRFIMGSNAFADAQPLHTVTLHDFWMDETEVTNAAFAAFVKATGYITVAERALNPADYPGVPADKLVPGSAVFSPPTQKVSLHDPLQWWQYLPGASWKHPRGMDSNLKDRANYPVVQVCYEDAAAYAKWAGKRLPTEAEWEYAAWAGKSGQPYYWGDALKPGGKWVANIFQGSFPEGNSAEDGFALLAPVKSFAANANGLYDMEGNVWEWCSDYYRPDYYASSATLNPAGPASSFDPDEPGAVKHVQRGGSFLCSDEYCIRYKAGSRGKGETSSASDNLGFRCVRDK
ncbi:MAG TPA: formylglycine-generating enzyme family protein [Chitinophagaceae bacterium]|nr:formylglycine-generating enzyme family protein [Chitinophagaceae bacterium]